LELSKFFAKKRDAKASRSAGPGNSKKSIIRTLEEFLQHKQTKIKIYITHFNRNFK